MKDQKEKSKFAWDASDYARHSGAQQKWARELITKLHLQGNEALLDIGCGDGKVTAEISSYLQGGIVVGLDNSDDMVALAQDKFPWQAYPNLSFRRQDARQLPFHQEFDVVFSNAALHWILDHRPVLQGIYRALKPNGRVVVQMGGKGNAAQVIDAVHAIILHDVWRGFFKDFSFPYGFYSPEEYAPWLQDAGFTVDSLELKAKDMIHENIENFQGWFRTTWLPYLQRIPLALREEFINVVTTTYLQANPPDQEGRVHTGMQRLEFVAIK